MVSAEAKEAAAALLPDVAATSEGFHDLWHTAGDDGYKSAIFHAAVRCLGSSGQVIWCTGGLEARDVSQQSLEPTFISFVFIALITTMGKWVKKASGTPHTENYKFWH